MADLNFLHSSSQRHGGSGHWTRPWVVVLPLVFASLAYSIPVEAANGGGQDLSGANVYLRFCAGCHGFDGYAEYPFAPSFAAGERLYKSDDELLRSVFGGRHAMPYWQGKLSVGMVQLAIAYLRTMDQRVRAGQPPRTEPIPELHYRFNPVGEGEYYWERRYW